MEQETIQLTFNVEDIFEDIPGDPDNVLMKIPPEICERNGWKEGDELTISLQDNAIVIFKK